MQWVLIVSCVGVTISENGIRLLAIFKARSRI